MSNTVIVDTSIVIKWLIEEPDSDLAIELLARWINDAHYLALAERENCEYWTADIKLVNATSKKLTWVRNLHDALNQLPEK